MTLDSCKIDSRWVVLQVRTGREIVIGCSLTQRGYEQFVPCYARRQRWSDRIKSIQTPLFPGYVFLRFDAHNHWPVVTIPGVIRFVGIGHEPVPVEDSEVDAIRQVSNGSFTFGPCQFLKVGETIEIREGPLSGLFGIVMRLKGKCRLVLSVNVLQKSMFVEIDGSLVARASVSGTAASSLSHASLQSSATVRAEA